MSDQQTGAWIDAAQRQPPDAWPRPCVCRHPTLGMYLAVRRWENGKWWLAGHFHDWADDNTIYWMEVYPLPDGTTPPGWPVTGDKEEETLSETELSLRRAWREALTGRTRPIETLWDDIEPEESAMGDGRSEP